MSRCSALAAVVLLGLCALCAGDKGGVAGRAADHRHLAPEADAAGAARTANSSDGVAAAKDEGSSAPARPAPARDEDGGASGQVAVSREAFEDKLRGRRWRSWRKFTEALGPEARIAPEVGGAERVIGGLSIAFVVIINALMWAVIGYVILHTGGGRSSAWAALACVTLYGCCVYGYCRWAYDYPSQRLITNFLFGAVPLAASVGSYILALLALDTLWYVRVGSTEEEKVRMERHMNPWVQSISGRLIFFLAVLPGLFLSLHLGRTVSTGFTAAATHFDVLSLCLFVDVGRFMGHLSYLVAPCWSIGKDPQEARERGRPGLLHVAWWTCAAWYVSLARLEAGASGFLIDDRTKIHTLVALNSYVFFPISVYLFYKIVQEETLRKAGIHQAATAVAAVLVNALLMLLVGMVFDCLEANLMGIAGLLWCVFYGAYSISGCTFWGFICALAPISALVFGSILLSSQYAKVMRGALLGALAP